MSIYLHIEVGSKKAADMYSRDICQAPKKKGRVKRRRNVHTLFSGHIFCGDSTLLLCTDALLHTISLRRSSTPSRANGTPGCASKPRAGTCNGCCIAKTRVCCLSVSRCVRIRKRENRCSPLCVRVQKPHRGAHCSQHGPC